MAVAAELAALEAAVADKGPGAQIRSNQATKFQEAISAWRTVDLTTLCNSLDTTASNIVAYQRDSAVQRKELSDKTKTFRKLDDSMKLSEIKPLLKAYQTFIDLLTNHSKAVNSQFLKAYTSLSEAPDPYPLLEASVDSMLISEETLPKLTEENERLQNTVAKLTSQLEDTESRLQTERIARKDLEENLEKRVKDVQSSWTLAMDEKKDNWKTKEKALEEKIEAQERLISEIKASYEVNQRLDHGEGNTENNSAGVTSAELDILQSDLERTSARLADVEARNEQLRVELAQVKASASSSQAPNTLEDDPAFMRMRNENSSLMRKLDAARVERDGMRRDLDAKVRSIEREVVHLKEERDSLKTKVSKWSDYEDVKQELEVLKSIEFSTGDDDEDGSEPASAATAKSDTLEKLLLARNKKLSNELTILRVSHQDLQSRLQFVQNEMATTKGELIKVQTLNEKLENDLSTLQSSGVTNNFSSGASVAGTYVSRYQQSTMGGRKGRVSPTSSIISGMPVDRDSFNSLTIPSTNQAGSILPMITAQRDRFKKRNAQLESELSDAHRTISSLRQEVASLQKDNLQLYEKTRYVSSYNRGHAISSSSSATAANPNPTTVNIGSTGNPGIALDRYRQAYESNLSPFAAFRGRESARAYKRMSLPERAVYSVTRMVLASRFSRNLFAGYCLALHLLVFWTLLSVGGSNEQMLHATSSGLGTGGGGGATWKGKGDDLHHV